jgi:hypothetical protein
VNIPRLQKFILIAIVIIAAQACAYVPSTRIRTINKFQDKLYVGTEDGYIKVLDPETGELIDKVTFPEFTHGNYFEVIQSKKRLIIRVKQKFYSLKTYPVYLIEDENRLVKIATVPNSFITTGADSSYYYAFDIKHRQKNLLILYRYDLERKQSQDFHLDNNADFVIMDVLESGDDKWYACLRNQVAEDAQVPTLIGKLFILRGHKENDDYELFEITDNTYKNVQITGDENYIWIYATRENSAIEVVRFSKNEKSFKLINTRAKGDPLKDFNPAVYLQDIAAYYPSYRVFYSDADYIWIGMDIRRRNPVISGKYIPYLIRFSKKDLSHERFLLKPTGPEAVKRIMKTPVDYIIFPFRVVILGFIFYFIGTPT